MSAPANIIQTLTFLDIVKRTGLPESVAYVNRQHFLGQIYRSHHYKTLGHGFLRWAEDFAYIRNPKSNRYEPFVWLNWQVHELLRLLEESPSDPAKYKYLTIVFCWPRRTGKTMVASLLDVYTADQFENQKIIIAANSEDQATSTAFELCQEICRNSPALKGKFGKTDIGRDTIYFPHTNSQIIAVPRSIPSMYGQSVNIGQTTELCVAKDDAHYQVLASSTGDVQGLMIVDSNFGSTSNKVYELVELGLTGQDETIGVSVISYKDMLEALEYNLSPFITEKWLRSRQMQMTSGEFRRNHLNQPAEGAEQMFTNEQLSAIVAEWKYPLTPEQVFEIIEARYISHAFGVGYDGSAGFSKNGDRSILSLVLKGELNDTTLLSDYPEQFGLVAGTEKDIDIDKISSAWIDPYEYIILATIEIPNSDDAMKQRIIMTWLDQFEWLSKISLEAYQAASLFQWCSMNNLPAELISPTTNVQVAMFNLFYQLVAARRIRTLQGQWLFQTELGLFQADEVNSQFGLSKQTKLKVSDDIKVDVKRDPENPETIRVKDDSVYSVAHSIYGLREAASMAVADVISLRTGGR